ncbi:MAG: DNA polymerase III subunit alpha [Coriobacteriales bacterium]
MAFVHLHNHSDFSILDACTRIEDMVKRAVELKMPAIALTDHGYMFGIPNLDLECRKYNDDLADKKQWEHDRECIAKGWNLEEPDQDPDDAGPHDRRHAQWEKDVAAWEASHDISALDATKPSPLIKPIFGCEAYFITDDEIEKGTRQRRYHLILLAKNETGYVNLMKMMSKAANEMYYYKPRTTLDMLKEYHEGIICQSACVQGIIQQNILDGDMEAAEHWALEYKQIFGDDFYIEIQDHGNSFRNGFTDRTLDEALVELAHKLDIKVVCTNDFHYLLRDDAPTQDIVSCIGKATTLDDKERMRMEGTEYYLKSEEEMRELFSWIPEACDNTLEVADKCNFELDWNSMYLPKFPDLEEGETSEERFRKECVKGLAKRYGDDWETKEIAGKSIKERFEMEYNIICEKGFADYFLIVQEYVQWAKDNGIGVGPGRGSAAGAIVAYAMNITTFDPLENGLMFERFLSPQRSEMPDIDMDFDDERRLEVVQHVRELYGADRVCHVITYSTIKAKQALNDANRVMGFPVFMGQKLSKMVSNDPKAKLKYVLKRTEGHEELYNPDFEDAYKNDPDSKRIIDAAMSIEGLTRGEGVHACAVLITPTPVNDHVPTKLDTKGGVEITQYEGHSVADMGLLKMDFLGLRTLTVISKALANIRASYPNPEDIEKMPEKVRACIKPGATCVDIDVDKIPFDDEKIFDLMGSGRTAGVFQIESAGMTATIKGMHPKEYRHVVALIALYRPGPLGAGMVSDYNDRMNHRKKVEYYDDRLADILEETYGTMVYQEQVMQISMKMCGFSAGESDSRIRKPVAKKKIKLLTSTVFHWEDGRDETTYEHWMNGAVRNGYSKEIAQKIWDDVLEFASYAFNKSHSAGYAILVMQTAWLKAYFPNEYMASVLTSYMGKTEKITHYVNACKSEGIPVLPPDINESGRDFTATAEGVRFGFAGIRGVGEGVGEAIMRERDANGPFKNLHDFVSRVDSGSANKRVVEALIKSGAFDSTGYTRRQLMLFLERDGILESAAQHHKDMKMGQLSMFDALDDDGNAIFEQEVPAPDGVEWDRRLKLDFEKEVMGMYVSDHPLSPYQEELDKISEFKLSVLGGSAEDELDEYGNPVAPYIPTERDIKLAGMITNLEYKTTKKGDRMATFTLESMDGTVDCVVFSRNLQKCGDAISDEAIVKVTGRFDSNDRGSQILVSNVKELALGKKMRIEIDKSELDKQVLSDICSTIERYPGSDDISFILYNGKTPESRVDVPVKADCGNILFLSALSAVLNKRGRVVV